MKKLFINFYRRNLALCELALSTNLQYRFNALIDIFLQPILSSFVEVLLWMALFRSLGQDHLAGFGEKSYLAYSLWAPFFGRISVSWMYEHRMAQDISSGGLNIILSRPISFYESYLSQLVSYKFLVLSLSSLVPLVATYAMGLPIEFNRIPLAFSLVILNFFFIHSLSFFVCILAFYFTQINGFTVVKNLIIIVLSGELVPFNLLPEFWHKVLLILPFSAGVYIPTAYITGRIEADLVQNSFLSLILSFFILNIFCYIFWKKALRNYTGVGA